MKYVIVTSNQIPRYKYKILDHGRYHKAFKDNNVMDEPNFREYLGEWEAEGIIKIKPIDTLIIRVEGL